MKTINRLKDMRSVSQYVYMLTMAWVPQVLTKVSPFILKEMTNFKIIPDFVEEAPPFGCQIDYGNERANFGNVLVSYQVEHEPKYTFWPSNKGKLYTLMMVGLDTPIIGESSPIKELLHWLVVNIPEYKFDFGECLAPYLPPDIKVDGQFRFSFLVFEQPEQDNILFEIITRKKDPSENARRQFSWHAFAKKYDLGKPYAINFFRAEKPDPMDKRPKQSNSDD